MKENNQQPNIVIYTTEDGQAKLQVKIENETVWLTQKQMAELFQKDVRTVNEHIKNIIDEGELSADSVIRNFRITAADGKTYDTQHYNLDVIISVGYRSSPCGAHSLESGPHSGCGNILSRALLLMMNGSNSREAGAAISRNCSSESAIYAAASAIFTRK